MAADRAPALRSQGRFCTQVHGPPWSSWKKSAYCLATEFQPNLCARSPADARAPVLSASLMDAANRRPSRRKIQHPR